MGIRDWWKERFAASPAGPPAEDPAAPAREVAGHEVAPGVRAREYHHAFATSGGPLPVRTLVTEGLAALGAPELRATLPRAWDENACAAALRILAQLAQLAGGGQPALLDGWTVFAAPEIGAGRRVGLTYARAAPIAGVPGSGAALAAVLLHEREAAVAQRWGAMRMLGRLGMAAQFFPFPPWWALRERPAITEDEQARSFAAQCQPYARLADVRATWVDRREVRVSIPARAAEQLREFFRKRPDAETLSLGATLAPDADGQLVWVPGAEGPSAITAGDVQPRRMGLSFVALVSKPGEGVFRVIEDGAGLVVSPETFARVRDAITAGRDASIPIDGETTLRLEARPDAIADPVSGGALRAGSGWTRYAPQGPARVDAGRVAIDEVVLLCPESVLAERVEVPALSEFIDAAHAALERAAGAHRVDADVRLAVQFTLAPGAAPRVAIAPDGPPPPRALLDAMAREVAGLAEPAIRGEVPFQLRVTVRPHPAGN